jgi:hypothetical protein
VRVSNNYDYSHFNIFGAAVLTAHGATANGFPESDEGSGGREAGRGHPDESNPIESFAVIRVPVLRRGSLCFGNATRT